MRWTVLTVALLLVAPATAGAEPVASLPAQVTVPESVGTARIPVTLSEPAPDRVVVSWRTTRSLVQDAAYALAGTDYVEASGTLEFAPGDTSEELAVTVLDDAVDDYGGYFAVELDDPHGARLAPRSTVDIAIIDDEPTPPASIADVTVREDAGEALVPVTRAAISLLGTAAYMWTPRPLTAGAPQDFAAVTGHGGIGSGQLGTTARVAIVGDARDEPDETFELVLAPDPAIIPFTSIFPGPVADPVATVTITDDDPPGPVVTVRRIGGRVRVGAVSLRGAAQLASGDRVDARHGSARITVARGGQILRTATITGGRVRLAHLDELRLTSARLRVGSTGMAVRARAARTAPVSSSARWIVRERAAGTQVRVLAGRVKARGAVLRAGTTRVFR